MQPNSCPFHLTGNPWVAYIVNMDDVFKALADGNRRYLLDKLFERDGQTLLQLCAHMSICRQAVTKHLKMLEQAGLVTTRRKGREKLHYLNPIPIREIQQRWIGKYQAPLLDGLLQLKQDLEEQEDPPQ